ncbi:FAD-dependent oxidoreductase [Thermoclostridium stercorarium]|uniref:(2Fe-2S)-binding protein n=1 Tax=Thermoclostridium stercorarium subsp. leptospartum DSM 9219 TaxID=1346611 RepID=A0A1B1YJH2_THEST|nr:FAD-dependent oxidoreductase [Thermoclostridium stercorarium]ANX00940.1 (2Fe-2S)-binding protein [Thermoclostridium stercorarium subsp. leptospartum DSM 9219]UZQ86545.1 FAD-dependent oxidoreductase [Thermoclostridium stercorarium]
MNNVLYKTFEKPPQSYWLASTASTGYPSLDGNVSVDIAIVGAGITGILCAYLLHKENLSIAVIDAGKILNGTTGHTTAKITSQHGLIYDKLKNQMGAELAKQYADANEEAIKQIKDIIDLHKIDCDYSPQPAYIYTENEETVQKIEDELRTASGLGIKASYTEEIPFPLKIKAGIKFDGQAQFHPRRFLLPVAEIISNAGVKIYENTRIVDLEEGKRITLTTLQGQKITAEKVIIASHYPFYNKPGMYFSRLYTERAYIIAVRAKEKYPGGMYINAEEPSRSLRGLDTGEGNLILVAGENHKTGQGTDMARHYYKLADFAAKLFTVEDIPYRWSTQDCMTLDGIPYVGYYKQDSRNILVATGFQKWGMTNGMAAANILRDLIVKGSSPWQDVYSPLRKNILGSAKTFVVENLDVAKHLISGKISPVPENVEIKRGEAKVFEHNGERVGAYRDENGKLFVVNTTCTHMGCELNWNSAEKSWDCPCHGSRFSYTGDIIDGPAVMPLSPENDVNTIEKIIKDEF